MGDAVAAVSFLGHHVAHGSRLHRRQFFPGDGSRDWLIHLCRRASRQSPFGLFGDAQKVGTRGCRVNTQGNPHFRIPKFSIHSDFLRDSLPTCQNGFEWAYPFDRASDHSQGFQSRSASAHERGCLRSRPVSRRPQWQAQNGLRSGCFQPAITVGNSSLPRIRWTIKESGIKSVTCSLVNM